jgi:hypothetical protein
MSNKMIVVEGPDGAGKTTLINDLTRDLNRTKFHTGGPKDRMDLMMSMIHKIDLVKKDVIFDRVPYISDPIYCSIYDRKSVLTPEFISSRLRELNPIIIYCRLKKPADMFNSIDHSKKEHKSEEHMLQVKSKYYSIVAAYDNEMERLTSLGFTVFKYNWKPNYGYQDLLRKIKCVA